MTNDKRLLKKLNLAGKSLKAGKKPETKGAAETILDMMGDPRYLRQSASLINEALQKGFDVLQLADGDIVTTGTKTVVYQYTWDPEKGKLVKTKGEAMKKPRRSSPMIEDEEMEIEDA